MRQREEKRQRDMDVCYLQGTHMVLGMVLDEKGA